MRLYSRFGAFLDMWFWIGEAVCQVDLLKRSLEYYKNNGFIRIADGYTIESIALEKVKDWFEYEIKRIN